MDEKIPEVPVLDEMQTTVAFGKAEPGRDIFAGEPVKEIKSDQTAAVPLVPPVEEKEISSVFSQSSTAMLLVDVKKSEESPASAVPSVGMTTVEGAEISIQTHPATVANDDGQKRPQGPLDEPAAEANRAAQELYPDAHDEK